MKVDNLARSDERAISLVPLGSTSLQPGSLVSIDVTPMHVVVRRGGEVLLCELPKLHDADWLAEVTGRGAYLAEFLAAMNPTVSTSGAADLRVLRFDAVEQWSESREIGVDDRAVSDVNRYRRRNDASADVISWLTTQLTLDSNDPVAVVATGVGEFSNSGFRLVGSGIVADVGLEDDRLAIVRVTAKPGTEPSA